MTSASLVVPSIPWMDSSMCKVNKLTIADRLLIISTYTKTVLMLATIQIFITLYAVIISSIIIHYRQFEKDYVIQLTVAVISVLIAFLIALLIAVVKKISEKYPLNVVFVIFYSIFMSTALGFLNTELCILLTLTAFGISMTIFTFALLIGAAIKTRLVDHSEVILISLGVISIALLIVLIALNVLGFQITILVSHLTVGKSRYLLCYPNYALASIFLYTVFFANLSVSTGLLDSDYNASSISCFELT
ncbi:unnamed protein product [Schistosoma turkestanicum]|nr:unnamed protein product [Schistosoma turkestanicum]